MRAGVSARAGAGEGEDKGGRENADGGAVAHGTFLCVDGGAARVGSVRHSTEEMAHKG